MPSSDPRYLIFLTLVAMMLPWVSQARLRVAALASLSFLFYMNFSVWYALILAIVTTSSFGFALFFSSLPSGRLRTTSFMLSLIVALAPLLSFKYLGSLVEELRWLGSWLTWIQVALPVGLSFYTFQAVGYLIDVYVGKVRSEE